MATTIFSTLVASVDCLRARAHDCYVPCICMGADAHMYALDGRQELYIKNIFLIKCA